MTNNPSGIKKLVAKTVNSKIGSVVKRLNSIANNIESKVNNSNRNKVTNRLSKYLLPYHKGNLHLPPDYNRWSINRGGGSRKLKNMRKNHTTRKNHRRDT